MTEAELMAQFEREYTAEICGKVAPKGLFDFDQDLNCYASYAIHIAYQMWKRAKTEMRTVTIKASNADSYTEEERDLMDALEKINVEVEFV